MSAATYKRMGAFPIPLGPPVVDNPCTVGRSPHHFMEMTIVLMTIVIGLIVGAVAKFLMPGRDPAGFLITIALGIGGALLATYGGQALGFYNAGEPAGFIGSVIGAIILLAIYHLITRRSSTGATDTR